MKATIIFIVLIQLAITVQGQDILQANLRWNSSSTTDLRTNESRTYACAFISRPGEIQWLQKGGQSVKTFSILQQTGSWANVAAEGAITFQVSEAGSEGTIVFQRSASAVTVTLDFSANSDTAIKRRFDINEIQPVN